MNAACLEEEADYELLTPDLDRGSGKDPYHVTSRAPLASPPPLFLCRPASSSSVLSSDSATPALPAVHLWPSRRSYRLVAHYPPSVYPPPPLEAVYPHQRRPSPTTPNTNLNLGRRC
jgi:hypothetical protein